MEEKNVQFYELEKIRFIVKDACGIDIAYAYEDLVFSEHGLFILQFEKDTDKQIGCWFNKECFEPNKVQMFNSLAKSATLNGLDLKYKGKFELSQKNDSEQIDIQFIEKK
jgi:hypothetical protein